MTSFSDNRSTNEEIGLSLAPDFPQNMSIINFLDRRKMHILVREQITRFKTPLEKGVAPTFNYYCLHQQPIHKKIPVIESDMESYLKLRLPWLFCLWALPIWVSYSMFICWCVLFINSERPKAKYRNEAFEGVYEHCNGIHNFG